jgi:hypothetical protein
MSTGFNTPFGLVPYEVQRGQIPAHLYAIATANATAVFIGDLVYSHGNSLSGRKMPGILEVTPAVAQGSSGSVGAVMACFDSNMDPYSGLTAGAGYIPVTTTGDSVVAGYVLVADDPMQLFLAQEGANGPFVAADMGLNANMIASAGSTTSGLSAHNINFTGRAVTATLDVKINQAYELDTLGTLWCRFIVQINNHKYGPNSAGI